MNKQKILDLLDQIKSELEEKKVKLEPTNFKVDSVGWTKQVTEDDDNYLVNELGDIVEIIGGEYHGEQLFTWDAAMRETKKAGKRMPIDKELGKDDFEDIIYAGLRSTDGSFNLHGTNAFFWSSSELGASAWLRFLHSSNSTVLRSALDKALGFSVRCLQD